MSEVPLYQVEALGGGVVSYERGAHVSGAGPASAVPGLHAAPSGLISHPTPPILNPYPLTLTP